jgi:hypothetical protein
MGGMKKVKREVVAADWLVERFREKRAWDSDELFRSAREANVSRNAIFEAKAILNLPSATRIACENGEIKWRWWVPENWERLGTDRDTGTVGTVVAP